MCNVVFRLRYGCLCHFLYDALVLYSKVSCILNDASDWILHIHMPYG